MKTDFSQRGQVSAPPHLGLAAFGGLLGHIAVSFGQSAPGGRHVSGGLVVHLVLLADVPIAIIHVKTAEAVALRPKELTVAVAAEHLVVVLRDAT